jgi:hypothetical protein
VALDDVAGLHGNGLREVLRKGTDAQSNEKGQREMSGPRKGRQSSAGALSPFGFVVVSTHEDGLLPVRALALGAGREPDEQQQKKSKHERER